MECLRDDFKSGVLLDGRFETLSPLNHGSFGMVFLAKDHKSGELVAIKCLTKPSSNASTCPSAFAIDDRSEELACHSRLDYHPNIVNLVHSFETPAHNYLVLEYCQNGDLYEAIRHDRGPLQTEHVREFMLQLVDAVQHMHSKGLYHRDIKPENIFLAQDGSVKLGDFGLATADEWSYEACVGSDRYMAPEQYDHGSEGYSPAKADIWSIGVCLLNILFSRNPFVSPTESDLLFLDYARDRESLFDVFPNMSQDTFEVLIHSMAIDPEKRSLSAVREAIVRAISFTTEEEAIDDFCTEERDPVRASANREPLRTPSIQSPHINQGDSFPWAKALAASPPMPIRQLSAIPDEVETYSEDLFPPSDKETGSWYSGAAQTPSMASMLDSGLGFSFKDMAIRRPAKEPPRSDPVPITGSLPSHMSKPIPAMSMVFGKKRDPVSKSWSDLYDEEEEESENERTMKERRENNARSWSQESKDNEVIRPRGLAEIKSSSFVNSRSQSPAFGSVAGPKSNLDSVSGSETPTMTPRARAASRPSPSSANSKDDVMDKWAALGNKRRAFETIRKGSTKTPTKKRSTPAFNMNWRRDWGLGSSGFDYGAWSDKKENNTVGKGNGRYNKGMALDWRRGSEDQSPQHPTSPTHHYRNENKHDQRDEMDEFEWVGGWHDLHL